MEDKILISSVLTDLTLASKTKFIDAKDNEELIKLAKSKGIDLPSPDLACFETYYCELDKPNLNNALLTKQAAEKGINSLVGKQININHLGKNYIIGYTIDAKIKDDMIIVTGILFKSLFQEEFIEIKELFEEGKLFVSFELWNLQPETGKSIIEITEDGIKKITEMIAHGVGLLLKGVNPACKRAQVFKLLANQKDSGEQIFQEDERFAYATLPSKEECNHCEECLCKKEDKIVEEVKVEEPKVEDIKAEKITEVKTEVKEEPKIDEQSSQVTPEPAQVVPPVEVKPEPAQVAEQPVKVEEKEKPIKTVSYYTSENIESVGEDGGFDYQSKSYEKIVRTYKDGHEEIEIREGNSVNDSKISKYTSAQLEEKVNAAKVEKDAEIATLKAEQEKTIQAKDLEIKNLNETKDKEIANMKQELDAKAQEIATLKVEKAKVEESASLIVGDVETPDNNETKQRANDIDKIIASKHQNK